MVIVGGDDGDDVVTAKYVEKSIENQDIYK
jgi:hypothetical protein